MFVFLFAGRNEKGQLGCGDTDEHAGPVEVSALEDVSCCDQDIQSRVPGQLDCAQLLCNERYVLGVIVYALVVYLLKLYYFKDIYFKM